MEDFKVCVDNEEQSREVQDLFFKLGGKWYSCGNNYNDMVEDGDYIFFIDSGFLNYGLGKGMKKITLQELRDMVNQEQDEPFLTPETTLNDQYAEIEQVRQSGMKFDGNKPRYSLLPKGAVNSVIEVLEFGAKKYSADNWQEVDNAKERYYNAAMRHIDLWWNGEKLDSETNVHHLAHAATNLFFLMWFDNK